MQMIDLKSGKLRWAFAVNPYIEVTQIDNNIGEATPLNCPGVHYPAKKYPNTQYIMGEQYVNMVSNWFFANANDNDVHEHFKCLEEVALDKAYVAESDSGELITFNCTATRNNNQLNVIPSEDSIKKIHVNLKSDYLVKVQFHKNNVTKKVNSQSIWFYNNE